jgi:hypothetical protein
MLSSVLRETTWPEAGLTGSSSARDVDDFHGSTVAAAASASTWTERSLGRHRRGGFVWRRDEDRAVVLGQQVARDLAHLVLRDPGQQRPRQVVFRLDAGKRFVGGEVPDVLRGVVAAVGLVALGERLLIRREHPPPYLLELRR